jgi:hypothetical protein
MADPIVLAFDDHGGLANTTAPDLLAALPDLARRQVALTAMSLAWGAEPSAPADPLGQLAACYEQCGPRARSVLLSLAERIARGATEYGDDFERPADWRKEAQAERLDALIYQTVLLELPGVSGG